MEVIITDFSGDAERILKESDPVEFFLNEFNKIHVGDRELGALLIASLGCQLCKNTDGLQIGLFGDTGTGKSDAGKAMFHLLSVKYKLTGSHSDKALFYGVLKEKLLYFVDELTVITEAQEAIIRESISNFRQGTKRLSVDRLKPIELTIPPRLAFWFTKQDTAVTLQMMTRLLTLNPDNSEDQDQMVFDRGMEIDEAGIDEWEITKNVEICRRIDEILKDLPLVTVTIPFVKRILWLGNKNDRRTPKQFRDTIKAFAAINQFQREKDPEGKVIASIADFERTNTLWKSIKVKQQLHTDNYGLQVLQTISEHGDDAGEEKYLPTARIAEILKWNRGKLSRIINGGSDKSGDQERGLKKLAFFRIEEGTKTMEWDGGKRTIPYHVAYVKKGWDQLSSFDSLAVLKDEDRSLS